MKVSISYFVNKNSLKELSDRHSIKAYKTNSKRFEVWCKTNRIKLKTVQSDPESVLQRYSDYLQEEGYSPATIHTYLAPVCKGFDVRMNVIAKPKRTADKITRSRSVAGQNRQGNAEMKAPEFQRLVNFQKAVGIRRDELKHLTGKDLVRDSKGILYVHVKSGKGGKEQFQRILPQHEKTVQETFRGVSADARVFSSQEMNNKIDLHALRAEVAKEAYNYYLDICKTQQGREMLIETLKQRFHEMHPEGKNPNSAAYRNFMRDMLGHGGKYVLRGENRKIAIKNGRPTEYDRLAVMAVSVLHLSHWRLDVTIVNYIVPG